jgi:RNA-directed DNA polymerase
VSNSTIPKSFPLVLNLWEINHLECALGGYRHESLLYFIDKKEANVKELTKVQNRNGKIKTRIVYNSTDGYKKLLKAINKKILQRASLPKGVLGGAIGKTIDDMAEIHCGKEALFVMDFKNFFPNIKSGMVFKFFKRAKCSNDIAGLLTDLVTLNGALPQGFPTSPMMANLIAYDLDVEHLKIATKHKLERTRWIDDIVFSGRIAAIEQASRSIVGSAKPFGFIVNNKKTRFEVRKERPVVVGLDVSRKSPHVPLVQIHEIERLLTKCETEGTAMVQPTYDPKGEGKIKDLQSSLNGRIRFVEKYDLKLAEGLLQRLQAINWDNLN